MTADDIVGPPDTALARALATPFAWPQSGLEPLPWFPFTVAASKGHTGTAERIAQRTERAYWYLRKLLSFTPRFRLLVLDRDDWPRFAEVDLFGMSHVTTQGNLVVGSEPANAWREIARELAARLPAHALRALRTVHGTDPASGAAPDLRKLAESLVAHEIARLLADQAGASFAAPWMKHAFANYALVAVLGETDPVGLHRLGTLAEATRALAYATPDAASLGTHRSLTPFEAMLVQLSLTRAAYLAYADDHVAPLARWFTLARAGSVTGGDAALSLARDVHPALGALAAAGREWGAPVPRAA